jgi:hypothetical protein
VEGEVFGIEVPNKEAETKGQVPDRSKPGIEAKGEES